MIDCTTCGKRHRDLTADDCADRKMTERTLQDRVIYRAKKYGWRYAHAGRGIIEREDGSTTVTTPMSAGWPDMTLAREGSRLLFIELKRQQGETSSEQDAWLWLLNQCGTRAIVIRPSHLREGIVDLILKNGDPL